MQLTVKEAVLSCFLQIALLPYGWQPVYCIDIAAVNSCLKNTLDGLAILLMETGNIIVNYAKQRYIVRFMIRLSGKLFYNQVFLTAMTTKKITNAMALLFIFSYMRRFLALIIPGILLLMVVDTVQLLIPGIVKKVIDTLGGQEFSSAQILKNVFYIAALAAGMTVLRFFYRVFLFLPSRTIEMKMRDDLFAHLTRLPLSFFNVTKTGDLLALFTNDINAVRMATGMALIGLTDALFMGSLSLAFMASIDVKLTLIVIAPLPLVLLFMIRFGGVIQSRFADVQKFFGTLSSMAQESFSGIRAVKGFVQEQAELKTFSGYCNEYAAKNLNLIKVWGVLFPSMSFLGSISIALLLLYGGRQVIGGNLSFGSFVSFVFYIQLLLWPIMAFGWVYNIIQRGIASAKRLLELRETAPEVITPIHDEAPAVSVNGHIVMKNLTFRFGNSDRDILRNINLDIPAGGSLGIIGKPGSGKTTLVSLLFHLFPVERGSLFIDGTDINDLPLPALRRSIGYVPQDSFLFSDTIANNIAFGMDPGAADEALIRQSGSIAAIDRDIAHFPAGYATLIGERGITLSGGQKQRVSIARAIILHPAILILDDALSSVDAGTEQEILSVLNKELQGRTSLIIAHRISTVRSCDQIIVLDNGAISERGTHDELVACGGFYARLSMLQAAKNGKSRR